MSNKPTDLDAIRAILINVDETLKNAIAILHTEDFYNHKHEIGLILNEDGRYFYKSVEVTFSYTEVKKGNIKVNCFPLKSNEL